MGARGASETVTGMDWVQTLFACEGSSRSEFDSAGCKDSELKNIYVPNTNCFSVSVPSESSGRFIAVVMGW